MHSYPDGVLRDVFFTNDSFVLIVESSGAQTVLSMGTGRRHAPTPDRRWMAPQGAGEASPQFPS
mgnify:CR=1 FL=1